MRLNPSHTLTLINLSDPSGLGDFNFQFFPRSIETQDKANYEALDTAGFVKPLVYSNSEAQTITFPELYLDGSDTNDSVLPDIERLRALTRRFESARGELSDAPPVLRLLCGEWQLTCVLTEVHAERTRYTSTNVLTRAKMSLTFVEVLDSADAPAARPRRVSDLPEFSF